MEPRIIYEDKNLLLVNKPSGLLVHHTVAKKEGETLTDWLIKYYPKIKDIGDEPTLRPGIVHRLDKETSGIMVIPKNEKTFNYLKSLFQKHEVKKTYIALVCGEVKNSKGTIDRPIGLKSGTTKRTVFGGKMIKEAVTEYEAIKRLKGYTLLRICPKTGRTHQIRVHLASIGYPIVGDKLYGGKRPRNSGLPINRHFLHADSLEFRDERGKSLKFVASMPNDLTSVLKSI